LEHLEAFDEHLADLLRKNPQGFLPLFEQACQLVATERTLSEKNGSTPSIQILIHSSSKPTSIRSLTGNHIGQLVMTPGIVISASRNTARATEITTICRHCKHTKVIKCKAGISSVQLPKQCERGTSTDREGLESSCPRDPYVVLSDSCKFVDQQSLKLQENPETVPTGEMPRHVLLMCDRYLVSRVVPGTRVMVVGIYTIFQTKTSRNRRETGAGAVAIRQPYLKVLGINIDSEGSGRSLCSFRPDEEEEFRQLARHPQLYELIFRSIAPAIYGHQDIKKAIACLLFGGSRKHLPDGMKLRGDINVLLLGDPGTAKSQFLKFVEKVAPIGVYTSGKGSSAAGLTASVIREPGSRQFYLEGGAMVLADGGVVCIDEFDKMHLHDRVAIHEAMEQQTISIAKAGITTVLNARSSVLAAANPVFGVYDDMRSPFENIEFQSTILSRFDMIFLVKDARDAERDKRIARHVIDVHSNRFVEMQQQPDSGEEVHLQVLDPLLLKRYVAFCRGRCAPRLSPQAAELLQNHYVTLRSAMRKHDQQYHHRIPITVRQLEAIVRISEALAKMSLSPVAHKHHMEEAIRLFTVSTVQAASAGKAAPENLPPQVWADIQTIETILCRRIPIGSTVSVQRLKEELANQNFSPLAIGKALDNLIARETFEFLAGCKKVRRKH
jgi:DNA replication licensing factor MCM5